MGVDTEICYYPEFPETSPDVKPIKIRIKNVKNVQITFDGLVYFLDDNGHTIMAIRKKLLVYYRKPED